MCYKYILLDFGKVLAYPTTGHWYITPKFEKLIDINKIGIAKLNEQFNKYSYITKEKITNLKQEYDMFLNFYSQVLNEYNINSQIIEYIAYDITYNSEKYKMYDNVYEELKRLSKTSKLIMVSDNWPCVIPILRENNLYDFFDKLYISSFYGKEKQDKVLFDYVISEYNIKPNEALFIDDSEKNLDIAKEKNLDVALMSRDNKTTSKYKVINSLLDIMK